MARAAKTLSAMRANPRDWRIDQLETVAAAFGVRCRKPGGSHVIFEHPAVAEAAVVPSPDPVRHAVPKAFVALVAEREPSPELARHILEFCRTRLAAYKRIRRLEFCELPKTISGKIRRVQLRAQEIERRALGARAEGEWFEEDFPQLRQAG